jgi:hypothetical protein
VRGWVGGAAERHPPRTTTPVADARVEELVGVDVFGGQALGDVDARLGVDAGEQRRHPLHALGIERPEDAVGPVGDKTLLLHDAVDLGAQLGADLEELIDLDEVVRDRLVDRLGVVHVVDLRLLHGGDQLGEALGLGLDDLGLARPRRRVDVVARIGDQERVDVAAVVGKVDLEAVRLLRDVALHDDRLVGDEARDRAVERPVDLVGAHIALSDEVVHVRRALEVEHRGVALADVGEIVEAVPLGVPEEDLGVDLQRRVHGLRGLVGRELDRLVGVDHGEHDRVVRVEQGRGLLESDERAARAHLDGDVRVDDRGARVDARVGVGRRLGGIDQGVCGRVLGLGEPVRLQDDRGRAGAEGALAADGLSILRGGFGASAAGECDREGRADSDGGHEGAGAVHVISPRGDVVRCRDGAGVGRRAWGVDAGAQRPPGWYHRPMTRRESRPKSQKTTRPKSEARMMAP